MLFGLAARLSALALDGVDGDFGEPGACVSGFGCDPGGWWVSMLGRSFVNSPVGGVFSRTDGLIFVGGDGGTSDVGERGGPPHWLMKDSTASHC